MREKTDQKNSEYGHFSHSRHIHIHGHTTQKMKFPINNFVVNATKFRLKTADLVTFTEEILNGKLHFGPVLAIETLD